MPVSYVEGDDFVTVELKCPTCDKVYSITVAKEDIKEMIPDDGMVVCSVCAYDRRDFYLPRAGAEA